MMASLMVASTTMGDLVGKPPRDGFERREFVREVDTHQSFVRSDSRLQLSGFTQFRYTYNNSDSVSDQYGFSLPRTQLNFGGEIGDAKFQISPEVYDSGNFELEEAFVSQNYGAVNLKVGQFRPAFNAEASLEESNSFAVERTLVSNTFGQDFTQGIEGSFDLGSAANASIAFTDGWNRSNTPVNPSNNNYGVTTRVQAKLYETESNTLATGAGLHWEDDFYVATGDVAWNFSRFNTNFSVNYSKQDKQSAVYSGVAQVSYKVSEKWVPYTQFEYADSSAYADSLNVATVGVHRYLYGKSVRWSTDVGYAFNGIDASINTANTGWSNSSKDGQFVIRTQLQLVF
jgi:hypothetical protein